MDVKDLENRFAYHAPPTEERKKLHEDVRYRCFELAEWINRVAPEGREKALAVTHLEEVMFWANGAVARAGDS